MTFVSQHPKRVLTVAAACVVAGVLVPLTLSVIRSPGVDAAPPAIHWDTSGSAASERTSDVTAPPLIVDIAEQPTSPRRGGVETNAVVEHPNLPVSPIATAYDLIEPSQEFRRTVAPGVPLSCDQYRAQIRDTGEWDPDVVVAIIWRESLCNERAVSRTNDWGLLQINATCWAGKGLNGVPAIRQLPDGIEPEGLQCDGATKATMAAEWCFHAKEQVHRTGHRPDSPCDAWLDPATNLRAAYEMWRVRGWQPWCFDASSRETPACRAAAAADQPQPEEH
ncbi:transglycosylase SLT domain-containing protein [Candidatus Poriferisodalis sp.]|uniref:transglycosylase SLT domain-containing protein n=1 Tax=Candidatus Poriferisodalis sp. TaxID=3101277 RepID=UPI003B0233A4